MYGRNFKKTCKIGATEMVWRSLLSSEYRKNTCFLGTVYLQCRQRKKAVVCEPFCIKPVSYTHLSEFEYAQKALRYGADDYLLKPLAAEDVTGILESINRRVKEENKKTAETAEGIFRGFLSGGKRETEEEYRKLENSGNFENGRRILLLGGYVGNTSPTYIRTVEARLKEICNYYTFLENTQEIYCLLQEESFARIQRRCV